MSKRILIIFFGLFVFLSSIPSDQDPPKKKEPQDTTVSRSVRLADSLYIEQKVAKMKLDSIYKEKAKKR